LNIFVLRRKETRACWTSGGKKKEGGWREKGGRRETPRFNLTFACSLFPALLVLDCRAIGDCKKGFGVADNDPARERNNNKGGRGKKEDARNTNPPSCHWSGGTNAPDQRHKKKKYAVSEITSPKTKKKTKRRDGYISHRLFVHVLPERRGNKNSEKKDRTAARQRPNAVLVWRTGKGTGG